MKKTNNFRYVVDLSHNFCHNSKTEAEETHTEFDYKKKLTFGLNLNP